MKKSNLKIVRIAAAVVFVLAFMLNVHTNLDGETSLFGKQLIGQTGTDTGTGTGTSTGTDTGTGTGNCPWYIPDYLCNKRTESIQVICYEVFNATVTYYGQNGQVVGSGIKNGAQITLSWGYKTSEYTISGGTTSPYEATKVNCPTDGKNVYCEPHNPCN